MRLRARVRPADDDLQPLRALGASRALGESFRGVGAAQAIGGRADDRLGTRQSAPRGMWWKGEKKQAVGGSRGRRKTKIHALADAKGPKQRSDL